MRVKQLSMAAIARVIQLCVCIDILARPCVDSRVSLAPIKFVSLRGIILIFQRNPCKCCTGVTHRITQAFAAIYSCFFLIKTQQHGKALTKRIHVRPVKCKSSSLRGSSTVHLRQLLAGNLKTVLGKHMGDMSLRMRQVLARPQVCVSAP